MQIIFAVMKLFCTQDAKIPFLLNRKGIKTLSYTHPLKREASATFLIPTIYAAKRIST
jgi:hypothetical protein